VVRPEPKGYALNQTLKQPLPVSDVQVGFPATTVVFCETGLYRMPGGSEGTMSTISEPDLIPNALLAPGAAYIGSPGALRHHGGSNYVFADGHVKWHAPDQVWSVFRGNDGQHPSFGLKPL
jgi:prepilin-type processing-associated H-X9-DG protein